MTSKQLRDYQNLAVAFLHANPRAGLFLDMGLGKSAVVLSALKPEHLPVLVVAPKRVAETVWGTERDIWRPDLSIALAVGTPTERKAALHSGADIVVISRDNHKDALDAKPKRPWKTLVLDELSGYKAKGSVRWKTSHRMLHRKGSTIDYFWGLTGTPAPNGMGDLWAPVFLMDRGERLERTLGAFRTAYFTPGRRLPNGIVSSWDINPGADKTIRAKISDICMSMGTEGRVKLPPITHNEVSVTLPKSAVKAYQEMRQQLITDLELLGGEIHTAKNAAILTAKLSQITAGFIYSDDYDLTQAVTQLHRVKVDAVEEIVEGTGGSPVLVFYQYRHERDLLSKLPGARLMDSAAVADWNAGKIPILLAHPESAGHGLNLQHGGHTVVWASLTWNLEHWDQANKRLWRSGQRHPVVIHRIMARGPRGGTTVDHLKYDRLRGKSDVQTSLMDHLDAVI